MKHFVLVSVAAMSFVALTSAGCSPSLSQPRAPMEPDMETSTTSLTSGEPLPTNRAPLEPWSEAPAAPAAVPAAPALTPVAVPAPAVAAAPIQTWDVPAPVAAPAVQPLEPWSYP